MNVQNARVHLLLARTDLLVSAKSCKCHLEEPFLANCILYLALKRLKSHTLLTQREPMPIASFAKNSLRSHLQILCLQPQILHDETAVNECFEDLASFSLLYLLPQLAYLCLLHLVMHKGGH